MDPDCGAENVRQRRAEIDRLDAELVRLLNQRASIALDLAQLKQSLGWEICDPAREQQVLTQVVSSSDGPFDRQSLRRIFRRIISESRRIEQNQHGCGGTQ